MTVDPGTTPRSDRAGTHYWEANWRTSALPPTIDPTSDRVRHFSHREYHRMFERVFQTLPRTYQTRLLELGCGGSAWLPYFARQFGFDVSGLDYTQNGCAQAQRVLDRAGVPGTVVCADLFDPPETMRGAFDVVVSFGLLEHFEDTSGAVSAFARFLAPGGVLFTLVPNMDGGPGWVQRVVDSAIHDVHVPLSPDRVARGHSDAGLDLITCSYFQFMNFGVSKVGTGTGRWSTRRLLWTALLGLSYGSWALQQALGVHFPPNRVTSPYVITAARRPAPAADDQGGPS